MLSLLGRCALSSPAALLSPAYRTPTIYRIPTSYRTSSTTSDGDSEDYEPIPPIIIYTHGIRGSQEQGSHMGLGVFVDRDHELNTRRSLIRKKDTVVFNEKSPELTAIWFALWRVYQWPSFLLEDVIIRTQFDPVVDEFEKWRKGDNDGSRSLQEVWRQMDKFPCVSIERADPMDGHLHYAIGSAAWALEEAESKQKQIEDTKSAPTHLVPSHKAPLTLTSKRKDEKTREDEE